MVADADGVVSIDDDIYEEVVKLAEKIQKEDKLIEADLKAGMGVEEAFKRTRPGYKVDG